MDILEPIVLPIPCLAACLHVPPRCRSERVADVSTTATVRVRRARRPDLAVSAVLLSASGKHRSEVLTDGTAHYAPIGLGIDKPLGVEALGLALGDPAVAHRLQLPRIGLLPGIPTFEGLATRRIVDDGLQAARLHAQAAADGWLVVSDVVHRRVAPPCQVVRFAAEDHRGRFHVEPLVAPEPPHASVYVRLSPAEDPAPYAAALAGAGREATRAKTRMIRPGDVPVVFGAAELLSDILACVPMLLSAKGLAFRTSAEIGAHARLGWLIRRQGEPSLDMAAAIAGTFAGLAASKADMAASALYAERLGALS